MCAALQAVEMEGQLLEVTEQNRLLQKKLRKAEDMLERSKVRPHSDMRGSSSGYGLSEIADLQSIRFCFSFRCFRYLVRPPRRRALGSVFYCCNFCDRPGRRRSDGNERSRRRPRRSWRGCR